MEHPIQMTACTVDSKDAGYEGSVSRTIQITRLILGAQSGTTEEVRRHVGLVNRGLADTFARASCFWKEEITSLAPVLICSTEISNYLKSGRKTTVEGLHTSLEEASNFIGKKHRVRRFNAKKIVGGSTGTSNTSTRDELLNRHRVRKYNAKKFLESSEVLSQSIEPWPTDLREDTPHFGSRSNLGAVFSAFDEIKLREYRSDLLKRYKILLIMGHRNTLYSVISCLLPSVRASLPTTPVNACRFLNHVVITKNRQADILGKPETTELLKQTFGGRGKSQNAKNCQKILEIFAKLYLRRKTGGTARKDQKKKKDI